MIVVGRHDARIYLVAFLIGCAVLVPTAIFLGRKSRVPITISVLYAMAVTAVGAITLPIRWANIYAFPAPQFSSNSFLRSFIADAAPARALTDVATLPEHLANVVIYIPVGLLGLLFFRKWWRALLAAATLSFVFELTQAISGFRDGSGIDFYRNLLGAAIGVAAVVFVQFLRPTVTRHARGTPSSP